jgi:hypothetical protein
MHKEHVSLGTVFGIFEIGMKRHGVLRINLNCFLGTGPSSGRGPAKQAL